MPDCWLTAAFAGLLYLGGLGHLLAARRHHRRVIALIDEYRALDTEVTPDA